MRRALFLTVVVLAPASAQLGLKPAPPAAVAAKASGTVPTSEQAAVPLQIFDVLEKDMNGRISASGAADPCVILGAGSRGIYINGFGAIFTGEVDLINSPGAIGIFGTAPGPEMKAAIRKRKQAHLPLLQQTMRDIVLSLSASPALKLADNDQVVVALRLFYRPWEDTAGLPGQIVMRLDHRGGAVKMEIQ
jgi:hypothetical protein